MQIARLMAGYSWGSRPSSPRDGQEEEGGDGQAAGPLQRQPPSGASPPILAETLFELMAKFAGYGFNKCHAAPYALIAYQTAWLKANAPVEFFAASMSLGISSTDKLAVFYPDARKLGVKILPPDVNRSFADFEVEDGRGALPSAACATRAWRPCSTSWRCARRAGRSAISSISSNASTHLPVNKRALETLALGRVRFRPPEPRPDRRRRRRADRPRPGAGVRPRLLAGEPVRRPERGGPAASRQGRSLGAGAAAGRGDGGGWLLSLRPPARPAGRRAEAPHGPAHRGDRKANAGGEAFRMAGVVRRRQERTASGSEESSPSSRSPTRPASTRCCSRRNPPPCREWLEPGKSVALKVRAKAKDGEVRSSATTPSPSSGWSSRRPRACASTCRPQRRDRGAPAAAFGRRQPARWRGGAGRRHGGPRDRG